MYTYIPSLGDLPSPSPSHPSGSSRNTEMSPLCYTAASPKPSVLHTIHYASASLSVHPIPLSLSCPPSLSLCLHIYSCPKKRSFFTTSSRFHKHVWNKNVTGMLSIQHHLSYLLDLLCCHIKI